MIGCSRCRSCMVSLWPYARVACLPHLEAYCAGLVNVVCSADIQVAHQLLKLVLEGHSLSRRESKLMKRVVADIFRVVPLSLFIIIPAAEFLLPFAVKIFPSAFPHHVVLTVAIRALHGEHVYPFHFVYLMSACVMGL